MLWFVSQSQTSSESSSGNDGWGKGARVEDRGKEGRWQNV